MRQVVIAALTALTLLSGAQSEAAGVKNTYSIDPGHTRVIYFVKHLGLSNFMGHFHNISGSLVFNPDNIGTSSVDVTIDAKTVNMDEKVLDKKLQGKEYFNTEKFPTITFKSTKVTKTGEKTGKITGDLTLLGVTKPVTLDVTFNTKMWNEHAGAEAVGFSAKGNILRSDFGMKSGIPYVSDEVVLQIEVEAYGKSSKESVQ